MLGKQLTIIAACFVWSTLRLAVHVTARLGIGRARASFGRAGVSQSRHHVSGLVCQVTIILKVCQTMAFRLDRISWTTVGIVVVSYIDSHSRVTRSI